MYQKTEINFIKINSQVIIETNIINQRLKWKYLDHVQIVNANELVTRINLAFNFEMNKFLIEDLKNQIDQLRLLSFETILAAKNYLLEFANDESNVLIQMLYQIKTIQINQINFILEQIVFEIMSIKNNYSFDNKKLVSFTSEKIKLKFQTQLVKIIEHLVKKHPYDQIFNILLTQHLEMIEQATKKILQTKKTFNS